MAKMFNYSQTKQDNLLYSRPIIRKMNYIEPTLKIDYGHLKYVKI